jgi:hypothetical protein
MSEPVVVLRMDDGTVRLSCRRADGTGFEATFLPAEAIGIANGMLLAARALHPKPAPSDTEGRGSSS